MEHVTIGKKYNKGKVAFVKCFENTKLNDVYIKDMCFLLVILTKGKLDFSIDNKKHSATSPAFLCFNEKKNPIFDSINNAQYFVVFFRPEFLNVNMSFEMLRSQNYTDIATTHDMFMLKPFIGNVYTIPIIDTQIEILSHCAKRMAEELEEQHDWYWSCRGRSYFIEIIITLERMYGLMGYGKKHESDNSFSIKNPKLRDAVMYIESHYNENITLSDISLNARINHATLTTLMKKEFNCTAMEYLMNHRIKISKKQLAFTDVPIKDIANMVGFKTVQHFNRIFKEFTMTTPAEFRKNSVQNRKDDFNGK